MVCSCPFVGCEWSGFVVRIGVCVRAGKNGKKNFRGVCRVRLCVQVPLGRSWHARIRYDIDITEERNTSFIDIISFQCPQESEYILHCRYSQEIPEDTSPLESTSVKPLSTIFD